MRHTQKIRQVIDIYKYRKTSFAISILNQTRVVSESYNSTVASYRKMALVKSMLDVVTDCDGQVPHI